MGTNREELTMKKIIATLLLANLTAFGQGDQVDRHGIINNQDYLYSNNGIITGRTGATFDGVIPITITRSPGVNTVDDGMYLVNPGLATDDTIQQYSPSIHFKGQGYFSGVVPPEQDVEWRIVVKTFPADQGGTHPGHPISHLEFQHKTGSETWTSAGTFPFFDSSGNFSVQNGGDANISAATVCGIDVVTTGGDASHLPKTAMVNNDSYGPGLALNYQGQIEWSPTIGWWWVGDTALGRSAPSVIEVNNGIAVAAGGSYGDMHLRSVIYNAVTVANLPNPPTLGQQATVTDGAASLNWGDLVVGGGGTPYSVWFNGTAWTVTGK